MLPPVKLIPLLQTKRQIWGNKSGLLCQHDHFHLFDDQCKLDPSESGGGLMSLLSGGGSGGLASLMSMFGMKE